MGPWRRPAALAWLLWPASLAFRAVVTARRMLYALRLLKSAHPGVPVIVVGNITVGGSGKTPLVLWIAEFLRRQGRSPAIVSRGYGSVGAGPREAAMVSEPAEVGDEPVVMARRSGCPVWVGEDRAAVARALLERHREVDVLILDDGLQHYALRRDIEIAVLDSRGLGNGRLLPAGPLREPASRLRSVDAVVANGLEWPGAFAMRLEGSLLHRMTDANDRRPASAFAGETLHAVAGIGNPERFFLHLRAIGLRIEPHAFPDHHAFRPEELVFGDGRALVMTEKDAVKLRRAAQPHWWVLPVSAELAPRFPEWLLRKLNECSRSKAA